MMDQFISCFGQAGHALLLDCRLNGVSAVALATGSERGCLQYVGNMCWPAAPTMRGAPIAKLGCDVSDGPASR